LRTLSSTHLTLDENHCPTFALQPSRSISRASSIELITWSEPERNVVVLLCHSVLLFFDLDLEEVEVEERVMAPLASPLIARSCSCPRSWSFFSTPMNDRNVDVHQHLLRYLILLRRRHISPSITIFTSAKERLLPNNPLPSPKLSPQLTPSVQIPTRRVLQLRFVLAVPAVPPRGEIRRQVIEPIRPPSRSGRSGSGGRRRRLG
jgi:hypothetical protein